MLIVPKVFLRVFWSDSAMISFKRGLSFVMTACSTTVLQDYVLLSKLIFLGNTALVACCLAYRFWKGFAGCRAQSITSPQDFMQLLMNLSYYQTVIKMDKQGNKRDDMQMDLLLMNFIGFNGQIISIFETVALKVLAKETQLSQQIELFQQFLGFVGSYLVFGCNFFLFDFINQLSCSHTVDSCWFLIVFCIPPSTELLLWFFLFLSPKQIPLDIAQILEPYIFLLQLPPMTLAVTIHILTELLLPRLRQKLESGLNTLQSVHLPLHLCLKITHFYYQKYVQTQ